MRRSPDPGSRGRRADAVPGAPLAHVRPAALAAGLYAVALLVWLVAGDLLPGGRWFAVHLFTIGVLSNLVVALTEHFTVTLLHTEPSRGRGARLVLLNAGAVGLLSPGLASRWPVALGGSAVVVAVLWLYRDLRRMRKRSLTQRFAFVVRAYERACGAFVHGSALGVLMGVGVLTGAWWGTARLAHLHLNILGWGGLTLLATVVFFGPTMMRTRIRDGADARAVRALGRGMTALTLGALLLLASGVGGTTGTLLRGASGVMLAGYAAAATVVCLDVVRAGRSAKGALSAWGIQAACGWFAVAVWVDALAVGLGNWRVLDAVGAVLLAGVLGQAILAALTYLAPMMASGGPGARAVVRTRLEVAAPLRVAALNAGVGLVAAGALAGGGIPLAAVAVQAGWALCGAVVLVQVALAASAFSAAARQAA